MSTAPIWWLWIIRVLVVFPMVGKLERNLCRLSGYTCRACESIPVIFSTVSPSTYPCLSGFASLEWT